MVEQTTGLPNQHDFNYQQSPSRVYKNGTDLALHVNGQLVGGLTFEKGIKGKPTILHYISTMHNEGQGYARALIQQLKAVVGPVELRVPDIIHPESWQAIRDLDLLTAANVKGAIDITDPEILQKIPLIRVLQSGGVTVEGLNIQKLTKEDYSKILAVIDNKRKEYADYFTAQLKAKII